MGGGYSKPNPNSFYDAILAVDQLSHVEPGWPIRFPNSELKQQLLTPDGKLEKGVKWTCSVLAVHGQYKRGKTFWFNLLTGSALPSGKTINTVGLSFKLVTLEDGGTQMVLLDQAGVHTPIVALPHQTMTDALAQRKATEFFLRDVAIQLADINMVVVTEFSDIDQEIMITLCKAIQNKVDQVADSGTREEVYVIHNFKNSTLTEAKGEWKKYVVKSYERVGRVKSVGGVELLVHNENPTPNSARFIQVTHVFICSNDSPEGSAYNKKVALLILNTIRVGKDASVGREINPLVFIKKACEDHIKNYLSGVDKLHFDRVSSSLKQFYLDSTLASSEEESVSEERLRERCLRELGAELRLPEDLEHATQFNAVCHAHSPKLSEVTLREMVANWLRQNEKTTLKNSGPLWELCPFSSGWGKYCDQVERSYPGDHLTLIALADVLQLSIYVISSVVGDNYKLLVEPMPKEAKEQPKETKRQTIFIAHFNECKWGYLKCDTLPKSIATAQGEVNKAINEYVLRTTATQFQTIELKEYQLNSVVGVQFDLSGDNYAVKFSECEEPTPAEKTKHVLYLDVPTSENLNLIPDKKERNKVHIEGVRIQPNGTIKQSNRKFGSWKHTFEIPDGYMINPKEEGGRYEDGTFILECIKEEPKPVIRTPVRSKTTKTEN